MRERRWFDSKALVGIVIAVAVAGILMTGCASYVNKDLENADRDLGETPENARFVQKGDGKAVGMFQSIVVDTETGVQYIRITEGHQGFMSVMLDAEGNPILDPRYSKEDIQEEEGTDEQR